MVPFVINIAILSGRPSWIEAPEDLVPRDEGRVDKSDNGDGSCSHDEKVDSLESLLDHGPSGIPASLMSVTARRRGDPGRGGRLGVMVVLLCRV